mmetsp:Transcript_10212/g.25657  ORF Transcript_10212/g.25657 Transcript_10212/m.25657 type:complete len:323 (+) Transcript_10212:70-1038(+)
MLPEKECKEATSIELIEIFSWAILIAYLPRNESDNFFCNELDLFLVVTFHRDLAPPLLGLRHPFWIAPNLNLFNFPLRHAPQRIRVIPLPLLRPHKPPGRLRHTFPCIEGVEVCLQHHSEELGDTGENEDVAVHDGERNPELGGPQGAAGVGEESHAAAGAVDVEEGLDFLHFRDGFGVLLDGEAECFRNRVVGYVVMGAPNATRSKNKVMEARRARDAFDDCALDIRNNFDSLKLDSSVEQKLSEIMRIAVVNFSTQYLIPDYYAGRSFPLDPHACAVCRAYAAPPRRDGDSMISRDGMNFAQCVSEQGATRADERTSASD